MKTEKQKSQLAPGQHVDETPMEYLRRVVHNCGYEAETLLDDLPTAEAVLEFFGLWKVYDTDFLEGIFQSIEDGDDPKPYLDFVRKYRLPWVTKFQSAERV